MTSTKRKLLLVVFAVALVVALSAGVVTAFALTTTDTVEYPFTKGADALKFAPTWTAPGHTTSDQWLFYSIGFDSTPLADMDYFVLQVKAPTKAFGFTVGALPTTGGARFDTASDGSVEGNKCYLVRENGTVKELSILYASINLDMGDQGMLVLPKASLGWRWGDGENVNRYYFTTNTMYNFDFSLIVGEIGYYAGDPADGGVYHSLWNPTLGEGHESYTQAEKNKYYLDGGTLEFPQAGDYPFATGNNAFRYAPTWKNVEEADEDVAQTLKTPMGSNLALSNIKKIAIQVKSENPIRLLVSALSGNKAIDTKDAAGQTVSFVSENGTKEDLTISSDGYIEIQGTGALVIPAQCFAGDTTMTSMNQGMFETDSAEFTVVIGEIGYYGQDDVYHAWYSIPNLAGENSSGITTGIYEKPFVAENSTVDHPTAPQNALKGIAAKQTYGDVNVYWQADAEKLTSHVFYSGGASGSVAIEKDSYGEDALQVQATASNGDGFMAMDVISAIISAEGTKGITFWAKNPSDHEISFNIEMDVRYKPTAEAVRYQNTRTNIKQGNRFWLYDVNTGKQTISMTRPTCALPAHFEGWVRIPYACFNRADWSKGDQTFMFENGVAKADTFIGYWAISYDTTKFPINQPFVVNNFGTYTTTPLFNSALVSNPTMTIPALMNNLPALPQVNEEV